MYEQLEERASTVEALLADAQALLYEIGALAAIPTELKEEMRAFHGRLKDFDVMKQDRSRVPIMIKPDVRQDLRFALMNVPKLHAVGYSEFIEKALEAFRAGKWQPRPEQDGG